MSISHVSGVIGLVGLIYILWHGEPASSRLGRVLVPDSFVPVGHQRSRRFPLRWGAVLRWLTDHAYARSRAVRRRREVIEICRDLASQLRIGRSPMDPLTELAQQYPGLLVGIEATAQLGGDVPGALRACAATPGAEGLRLVAVAWQTSDRCGASLAAILDRLADGLAFHSAHDREVAVELGGARATARLLAALPVLGSVLGIGLGAESLVSMTRSLAGMCTLLVGGLLELLGVMWMRSLLRAAERSV
jgi:tight adherence protein B